MADDTGEIGREAAEAVGFTNIKVVGDGPSFYTNLAYANAVSHQHGMNQIQAAIIGKIAEMIINTDPSEGGAGIAGLQALAKMVQTIPPPTTGQ